MSDPIKDNLTEALALINSGHPEKVVEAATRAIDAARELTKPVAEAGSRAIRADALGMLGQYQEALAETEEAAKALSQSGSGLEPDRRSYIEAHILSVAAKALHDLRRYRDALEVADEAIAAAKAGGNEGAKANALLTRSNALRLVGDYHGALAAAKEAVCAASGEGLSAARAGALEAVAHALRMLQQYPDAVLAATEAATAAEDADSDWMRVRAAYALGIALADRDNRVPDEALTALSLMTEVEVVWPPQTVEQAFIALAQIGGGHAVQRAALLAAYVPHRGELITIGQQKTAREEAIRTALREPAWGPPLPEGALGGLWILRKWASYSAVELMAPAGQDLAPGPPTGGGYLLLVGGLGIVIDPGLGFGANFRRNGFMPRNMDVVVATHHHVDHTGDMLPILTCLFEMHDEFETHDQIDRHQTRFCLAPGAYAAFADLLAFGPSVSAIDLLSPGREVTLDTPKGISVRLRALAADHRDLTGRDNAAIGLRVDLYEEEDLVCTVGFTGDTSDARAAEELAGADLLVANVGSVYPKDIGEVTAKKAWHLGVSGTVQLLRSAVTVPAAESPQLVVLSEWGEEMAEHRRFVCNHVAVRVGMDRKRVIPAEMGGRVALFKGRAEPVCCYCRDKTATRVVAPPKRDGTPDETMLEYWCDADHSRP